MYRTSTIQRAESLLGYPLRRAAASELLYGGVRLEHLVPKPFELHKTKSEELPSPSLQRERHDLELEMSLPRDINNYNNIHRNIQHYVNGNDLVESEREGEARRQGGFDMSAIFGEVDHPEQLYNSSARLYSRLETRNILGYRVFPINIGSQWRGECIRIRTEDCLKRLKHYKLCASHGLPLQFPLSSDKENELKAKHYALTHKDNTLYEIDPENPQQPVSKNAKYHYEAHKHLRSTRETLFENGNESTLNEKEMHEGNVNTADKHTHITKHKENATEKCNNNHTEYNNETNKINDNTVNAQHTHCYSYLQNGPCHPHSSQLSIFTRPADQAWYTKEQENNVLHGEEIETKERIKQIDRINEEGRNNSDNNNSNNNNNKNKNNSSSCSKHITSLTSQTINKSTIVNQHQSNTDKLHMSNVSGEEFFESLFSRAPTQSWMPLQMLKPKGNTYSPTLRGSGVRAANNSLYQERLNRRGFGWKKKSRSLWQQDINTHGFSPERHY